MHSHPSQTTQPRPMVPTTRPMAASFFTKSDVITVIMYYDQSIKPLRDSNRLYYAAITTNQLIVEGIHK